MKTTHIDIGGPNNKDPILLLCGIVPYWHAGAHDHLHVGDPSDKLEQVNCEVCKNHPDRSIHELKYAQLED